MKNLEKILVLLLMVFGLSSSNAQDWPNLERFREANAQLQEPGKCDDGRRRPMALR